MRILSARGLALLMVGLLFVPGCGRKKADFAFITNGIDPFWTFAQRGTEKAAKDLVQEVDFKQPPLASSKEQQQYIEDLLAAGVKGIAISPVGAKDMGDFFKSKMKNIPLILVDSDVPDTSCRRAYIGTHNYRAGRAVGEMVKKAVPKGGKLAIFVGRLDVQNAVERRQGVLDFLAGIDAKEMNEKTITPFDARDLKVGDFMLVDTFTDGTNAGVSQQKAEDLLTRADDIAVMVGLWAYNPPAMLQAKEKLKAKAVIVGFDEDQNTLIAIREGKIVGTVVQAPFEFGYQSIRILHALSKGDDGYLKKNYPNIDAENRIYIDHRVITKDNVEAFHAEVKKLLKP